jgi:serine/threonine protein phosphatase 1
MGISPLSDEKAMERKIFAVGDIHGNHEKLVSLLSEIPWRRESDLLVFLGDYIDRGKRSREVVEHLIRLKQGGGDVVFLLGNHERLLLTYYASKRDYDLKLWRSFGGWETIENYTNGAGIWGDPSFLPPSHLKFFRELLPYYETTDYIFVHAGLRDGISLPEQKLDDLTWMRKSFTESNYSFGKTVVFGHTPMRSPYRGPGKIGIDTGAGFGNTLTAVELPAMRFYHA